MLFQRKVCCGFKKKTSVTYVMITVHLFLLILHDVKKNIQGAAALTQLPSKSFEQETNSLRAIPVIGRSSDGKLIVFCVGLWLADVTLLQGSLPLMCFLIIIYV